MKNINSIGIQIPEIVLPNQELDLSKWAVIACDQFTSQPEYWDTVKQIVGNSPSTLNVILPEVYLESHSDDDIIRQTQNTMRQYLRLGIFSFFEGFILVERSVSGKTRQGLMLALDLEQYDFNRGSKTLIRATEGTIIERLPPRIRIRQGAVLEFPHILVLIDDPDKTVIEPLFEKRDLLKSLYDFELMQGSGHIRGFGVNLPDLQNQVIGSLEKLADPETFRNRYGVDENAGVLLFAMGDGNHSLASAKAIWEDIKGKVGMDDPARYALVEIENVHSDGLKFEPIHRVVFNLIENPIDAMKAHWKDNIRIDKKFNQAEMVSEIDSQNSDEQKFGFIYNNSFSVVTIKNPETNLPVGTLQNFLDPWLKNNKTSKIDYVHGEDITCNLGNQRDNCGFYLPVMSKDDLFKTVILDGALPRKTFSMGEAIEKRFYLEGRLIEKLN
jgi:hypothetical protein